MSSDQYCNTGVDTDITCLVYVVHGRYKFFSEVFNQIPVGLALNTSLSYK